MTFFFPERVNGLIAYIISVYN